MRDKKRSFREFFKGNYINKSDLPVLAILVLSLMAIIVPSVMTLSQSQKHSTEITSFNAQSPTSSPTPSSIPTPTPEPTIYQTPIANSTGSKCSTIGYGNTVKEDEHTSVSCFGADERMATPDELFSAINVYRLRYGVSALGKNDTLCYIAQTRANQILEKKSLDNHEGFQPLAKNQTEFNDMDEILFGSGLTPHLAVHIVEWGWGTSVTGHREAMLDPHWTNGCGGIAGYFAVFEFGAR